MSLTSPLLPIALRKCDTYVYTYIYCICHGVNVHNLNSNVRITLVCILYVIYWVCCVICSFFRTHNQTWKLDPFYLI